MEVAENKKIELSIIVPGFNEGSIIRDNLIKIMSFLDKMNNSNWELIFINDGSTDDTLNSISDLEKTENRFRIISYKINMGRGYALRRGFSAAKGKYILSTESDMNYGLQIIKELYEGIKSSNTDIIVASPYMKNGRLENVPFLRAMLSRYGNKVLSYSLGGMIKTVSGMVRIYKGDCINSIPLVSNDKEIHIEIISKAIILGYKVNEIPAILSWPSKKEIMRSKRKSSFKPKKYIVSHLIFSFFEKPFFIFGFLGFLSLFIGFGIVLFLLFSFINGNLNPERPLMTVMVVSIIGGVSILSLGLLGMQINDIRKEIFRIQQRLKQ